MINTKTFQPAQSRWQDIYKCLAEVFDTYPPGVKVGECTGAYVVVKHAGSSKHLSFSTDIDLYDVMVYVPKQSYSTLEPLVQQVKKQMKGLEPMILPYGMQTPSYYDDKVKAHTISITYKNYKKL